MFVKRLALLTVVFVMAAALHFSGNLHAQDNQPPQAIGFARFAHTAVDVGPVDIYVGINSENPLITNLEYGSVTDIYAIPVTGEAFVARAAGDPAEAEPLFVLDRSVESNVTAIVTAAGLQETVSFVLEPIIVVRNNFDESARLRIVNLVWGDQTVSVRSDVFGMLSDQLGYLGVADRNVEPETTQIDVLGPDGTVLTSDTVTFEANTHYALLVHGDYDGEPAIELLVIETPQETARVQFVHNGSSAFDLFISGQNDPLATSIEPGSTTEFYEFPTGAYTFLAKAPGAGADSQDLGGIALQLYPGRDYVVNVTGDEMVEMALQSETVSEEALSPETTAVPGVGG